MKTLPVTDQPSLLVVTTKDHEWFSKSLRIPGLRIVPVLDSETEVIDKTPPSEWYKIVVFIDALSPPNPSVLEKVSLLRRPLVVVVPTITQLVSSPPHVLPELLNSIVSLQSRWFNSVGVTLSSASFLLIDGLWSQPYRALPSLSVLVPLLASTTLEPLFLPPTLSLISTPTLLNLVAAVVSQPKLSTGGVYQSESVDTKRLLFQATSYFQNCFQHQLAPMSCVEDVQPTPLPHLKSVMVQTRPNETSEFTHSLLSPSQNLSILAGVKQKVATSLRLYQNSNTVYSTAPPLDQSRVARDSALSAKNHGGLPTAPSTQGETSPAAPPPPTPETQSPITPPLSPSSLPTSSPKQQPDVTEARIDSQLQHIFTHKRVEEKTFHLASAVESQKKTKHKTRRRTRLFWSGSILTGTTLALAFFAGIYLLSSHLLTNQVSSAVTRVFQQNNLQVPLTMGALGKFVNIQNQVYDSLFDDPYLDQSKELVAAANTLQRYVAMSQQVQPRQNELLTTIFSPSGVSSTTLEQFLTLYQTRHEAWQQLLSGTTGLLTGPSSASADLEKTQDRLRRYKTTAALAPFASDALGFSGKKTYAVLFQNSQELRPTGGFLQSLALLTFDQGKLISSRVYSSYDIDVLLGGRVAAPGEIEEFLGEKQLFFRDSNWDADFAVTAEKIRWYLDKSLNTQVDGILALSTPVLGRLIEAVGPLSVPEFNEVVTAQNVTDRLESHSEVQGLSPDQPREYSAILLDKIVQALPTLTTDQTSQLIESLVGSLNDANSVFYSAQPALQQRIVELGWSGEVLAPPCPPPFDQKDCRVEPLYLVEANVGINKANQYVQRKATHQIKIDEKENIHNYQITYENQAKTSAWPKGAYKAYVRLYLPTGAEFTSATVNGAPVDTSKIKLSSESDRPIVGVLTEVPIKSQTKLDVAFTTPPTPPNSPYVVFHQKQPGTTLPPTSIQVTFPSSTVPKSISSQGEILDGQARFTPTANPHFMVGLSL